MRIPRLRRHCYDKFWRCPGWAGGGWRVARTDVCASGSFAGTIDWDLPMWRVALQFHRCATCGTVAIPYATRWVDPTYLRWRIVRRWERRTDYRS